MSINFHCQSCKKKIKAPDDSGGKWGSCPYCNHRNYVPRPKAPNEEELKLVPIDESEETQYGSMMEETFDVTQEILHETDMPEDDGGRGMGEKEVLLCIVRYLQHMSRGQLDDAEEMSGRLKGSKELALDVLNRLGRTGKMEPELEAIPHKLLVGFMKTLREELS